MTEYRVTAPCVYAQNGRAVMHLHAGAFVELEDDVAATVADCVQRIDRSESPVEVEAPVEEPAEPVEVAEVVEPEAVEPPTEDDAELAAARRERRNRGRSSDG